MLRPVSVLLVTSALLAATPLFAQQAPETAQVPGASEPAQVPSAAPEASPAPQATPAPEASPASEASPAPEAAPAPQPAPAPEQTQAPSAGDAATAPGSMEGQSQGGGAVPGNQFCSKDLTPLLVSRGNIAQSLSAINKRPKPKTFAAFKKNFNDFCGHLSAYIANDRKIVDYMKKNKDFCGLDDQTMAAQVKDLENATKTHAKICKNPPKEPTAPPPGAGGGRAPLPKPPVNLRLQ